jgi:hypothetical protein
MGSCGCCWDAVLGGINGGVIGVCECLGVCVPLGILDALEAHMWVFYHLVVQGTGTVECYVGYILVPLF